MEREQACPKCGYVTKCDSNFCKKCGTKLKAVCDCWLKKEPYNCGQSKCPGYRLFQLNKVTGQAASLQARNQSQ